MLIVGNWKAYVETRAKAKALYQGAKRLAAKGTHEIVVASPFPYLGMLAPARSGKTDPLFAAQDVSRTVGGAQTGEVTAGLLKELGVTYVLVGHSERRAQGESDALVLEKVRHVLAHGMVPIVCVGERARDVDALYLKEVRVQVESIFRQLSTKERLQVVIAYEPIWAIGKTGADAITPVDLREMVLYIRKVLAEHMPGRANQKVRILYGGSVEAGNIRTLAGGGTVDGFLVGHASTDVVGFSALVKALD